MAQIMTTSTPLAPLTSLAIHTPSQEEQKALDKAKIALLTRPDSVFFSEIAFSFKYGWSNDIPTACTDGKQILLNPQFFMSLTPDERVFLILHESLHVAYLHTLRLGSRNFRLWNMAADFVINLSLVKRGFKMPSCGLLDPRFDGLSTEQVYDILEAEQYDQPKFEQDFVPSEGNEEELADLQSQIENTLVRASIRAEQENNTPGSIPADIQILLNKLLKPKLPWQRILARYLQRYVKADYTFKRPNRRYWPDYFLPRLYSQRLVNMAVAVDTSGSITDTEFNRFISEVAAIFRMSTPEEIQLLQFDANIKSINQIRQFQQLASVQFRGRGGTDITPVLEWASEHRPQLLLVFTDGYFNFPRHLDSKLTAIPTLWLIHGGHTKFAPPFGTVIHYEV